MAGVESAVRDLRETAEMIKFQHTVFALPFALISLISAVENGWPPLHVWIWVTVAMVSARTAAMSFNRLADRYFDAENPRTRDRALPAGRLSIRAVWGVTVFSLLVFVMSAAMLNRTCFVLAVPTILVLLGYSYAKRFTSGVHFWLGFSLAIAPIGAWIAVTGTLGWPPVILGAAVLFWVAGFDVIYSMQDAEFDRSRGLHSIPARLGPVRALIVARAAHLAALLGFAGFAYVAGGGPLRWLAVSAAAVLLLVQHRLVHADDLSRVDAAFFSSNGALSVVMGLLFTIAKVTGW